MTELKGEGKSLFSQPFAVGQRQGENKKQVGGDSRLIILPLSLPDKYRNGNVCLPYSVLRTKEQQLRPHTPFASHAEGTDAHS